MKVSDIMPEEFDDCVGEQTKEIFHKEYQDINAVISMDYKEILELMQGAQAQQKDINFQKEEAVLNKFLQINEDTYIPKNEKLNERFDQLHDIMNREGSIMTTVTAIQEFVRLLNKHVMTESAWKTSDEGSAAIEEAEETCREPSDPYARYSMKRKDFV